MSKTPGIDDEVNLLREFQQRIEKLEKAVRELSGIRGSTATDGSIASGTGFSVVKNGPGDFMVTFDNPFDHTPVVVLSSGDTSGTLMAKFYSEGTVTRNGFRVVTFNVTSTVLTDSSFSFIAT